MSVKPDMPAVETELSGRLRMALGAFRIAIAKYYSLFLIVQKEKG